MRNHSAYATGDFDTQKRHHLGGCHSNKNGDEAVSPFHPEVHLWLKCEVCGMGSWVVFYEEEWHFFRPIGQSFLF